MADKERMQAMSHRTRHPSMPVKPSVPVNPQVSMAHAGAGGTPSAASFPSEHRRGLLPEPYFHWRGGEITRPEAFCDVVFGFALTLLVVSLEVPHSYAEMMAAMRGFLPFAVCFAQLVMIWLAHYRFSRRFGLEDPYTVFLNIVLLFLVLFYVYPLKFVFALVFSQLTGSDIAHGLELGQAAVMMRIYAVGLTAVFSIFALMYAHAYHLRKALELNALEVLQTRSAIQENIIMVVVGTVSFVLSYKNPALSGWWYFVLGPALGIHGAIYGKRTRLLAEKLGLV
jgi:uncharacterized membrane protein